MIKAKRVLSKEVWNSVVKYYTIVRPKMWYLRHVKAIVIYPVYYLYKSEIVKNFYFRYISSQYLMCNGIKEFYEHLWHILHVYYTDKDYINKNIQRSMYDWEYTLWLYGDVLDPFGKCGVPDEWKSTCKSKFWRVYTYIIKHMPAHNKLCVEYMSKPIVEYNIQNIGEDKYVTYKDKDGKWYFTRCKKDGKVEGYIPYGIVLNNESLSSQLNKFCVIPSNMIIHNNRHEIL